MKIGTLIKQERIRCGLSQEYVAKHIGSTKQAVYKYENGIVTNIPMDKIEKMAELFSVSPSYLMGWENEPPINQQRVYTNYSTFFGGAMNKFSYRLRDLRAMRNLSLRQLSTLTGISTSALHSYEKGERKPKRESLEALADVFNVDVGYLLGISDTENSVANALGYSSLAEAFLKTRPISRKRLPLLGNVACGEPIFAQEEHGAYVDVSDDTDADFCLTAQGDSMVNARIFDGDILFVEKCEIVDDGQIAVVLVGDEATVKRFYYDKENGIITLVPENPMYKPMRYTGHQLGHIRVLGKVVAGQYKI